MFQALEVSLDAVQEGPVSGSTREGLFGRGSIGELDLVRSLRRPVERLRARDRALSEQIRRAASGIALNLAEGRRRVGADRRHHFRIAAGSAEEVRTALRVAEAWGDLPAAEVSEALELLDRVLAMAWRLTR